MVCAAIGRRLHFTADGKRLLVGDTAGNTSLVDVGSHEVLARRRRMKASGSSATCVVPSRQGFFNRCTTWPESVRDRLPMAIGGLAQ